jgi:DNA-binding MarR family transcriptional regulator
VTEVDGPKRGSLQDQVLARLAGGVVQTRAALREALGVKNQRLGEALESLEQAGQIRRTPTGWRRVD